MRPPDDFVIAGKPFPLAARIVDIAGSPITLLAPPYTQAVLEEISLLRGLGEKGWPYWLEDWKATYALAEMLAEKSIPLPDGPILDLGCGLGFLGKFMFRRFGRRIFSCDFNPDACRLAAMNIPAGKVFCADMTAFPSHARFSLVLAGEMLYARANREPLLSFLSSHLASGGSAWFADPGRSAAEGFAEEAAMAGFDLIVRDVDSPAARRPVHIYGLTGKAPRP